MPNMADLIVKKADGTTDETYNALAASSGDTTPAYWRRDTSAAAALPVGLRASFSMQTKWNGNRTARVANFNFVYPYATQDSTTTVYSAKDRAVFRGDFTLPVAIPASFLNEAAAQGVNLLATALIKSCLQAGYAPT